LSLVCPHAVSARRPRRPPPAVTATVSAADTTVERQPGESLTTFARRLIAPGATEAFAPLEFANAQQDSSVVLLFRDSTSESNFSGVVWQPAASRSGHYSPTHLPSMDEAPGLFEITVRSLFVAPSTRDTSTVIVVQYEYYRTGSGESPGIATTVYRARARAVAVDTVATAAVQGIRSTREIRARLEVVAGSQPKVQSERPR
jgi:hypothetical protein